MAEMNDETEQRVEDKLCLPLGQARPPFNRWRSKKLIKTLAP